MTLTGKAAAAAWMILSSLWLATAASADEPGAAFKGRAVVAVIDEFRAAGVPFAYSTNLVGDELTVLDEPVPADALGIVRQILAPHGLTVREEAGVFLVVRQVVAAGETGSLLVVVTAEEDGTPLGSATVTVEPAVAAPDRLSPGVFEYPAIAPGRYRIQVSADGHTPSSRLLDIWPGDRRFVPVDLADMRPEIETISVSASRYEILRELASSRYLLDQRSIQSMPDFGEDAVRIAHRLPGAAASGASAKTYVRGGEASEVGIFLNGQRLFDPFHVRDYQSVFSAIDARAIEGVEIYTGGFPVLFGNRMSGMVLMESLDALESRHTEIGLSVYNASVLTAGRASGRRWLFSARRGNLDLVIDPQFGSPSYYDVFAQLDFDIGPSSTLSMNALYADDQVEIILESDPEELERVVSDTRNAQFWLRLDNEWSDALHSSTVLSVVSFDNLRRGSLNDEEKIVASINDSRDVRVYGVRQDFTYVASDRHLLRWGLELRYGDARYDYRSDAEYFGLQALYLDRPETLSLNLSATPNGAAYAAWFSDRWRFGNRTAVEWGLRWDDQTYTDLPSDAQLSPRLSVVTGMGPSTELRFSWGRYHQSQEINELQIEDGVLQFWPAQRADHFIAGVSRQLGERHALRIEAFHKSIDDVRPRFENLFDPLGLIPEVQPDRVRVAPESAAASGLEISLERHSGAFTWWSSYTLSEVTDRIAGREERRSWDQRHAFQGGLSWSNEKWDLSLAGRVHSGWPLTELTLREDGLDEDGEPLFVAVPGPRNAGRHDTIASLDIRVSRRWRVGNSSLMAFIEVANVTNRQNGCCLDFDLEEDEDTGEIIFERGVDYWMGILPAIGILWEF